MFQVKMPAVRRKCRYQNAGGGILYYRHFHSHSTKVTMFGQLLLLNCEETQDFSPEINQMSVKF